MRRARPWGGSGSASARTCPRRASSRARFPPPSTWRSRPPPRSRSTPRSTGSRLTRSTSTAATGAAPSSAPSRRGAEGPLELHLRVELEARERRVRHTCRAVDGVREVAPQGDRERIQELVVDLGDRALEVRPAEAEVVVGEGRDDRLLAEVLPVTRDRPVAARLRLPEREARLYAVRVVGRSLPVVDVVGERLERLRADQVG